MSFEARIKSANQLGKCITDFLQSSHQDTKPSCLEFRHSIEKAEIENPWFTQNNILLALEYWANMLNENILQEWYEPYIHQTQPKTIGVIGAGNIPMVAFHDVLAVLIGGHTLKLKLSSKDKVLIPFLLDIWKEFCPELSFEFVERLQQMDAVICTGSNNTAQVFEHYFQDIPHIIRRNRTAVAVVWGDESTEELEALSKDIFSYFGLGCRNVTHLFVPQGYDITTFATLFSPYQDIIHHHKYANNYDYHKAIYLLNQDEILDFGNILVRQHDDLFSPLAVLHYSVYNDIDEVLHQITSQQDTIQCVLSSKELPIPFVPFGNSQSPQIDDYADGVHTLEFLSQL